MKYFIKNSMKAFIDYIITLIIFVVFLYPVVSLSGEKLSFWLPVYSFIIFLLLIYIVYSDYKSLAVTEKRPQYNLNPYPHKGLFMGIVGFIPFYVIAIAGLLISFNDEALDILIGLAFKGFLGPLLFIIQWGGETILSYVIAFLIIPIIVMLGYMAGYYGFSINKKKAEVSKAEKAYAPSPWNPTVKDTDVKKKKKRKVQKNG